VEGGGGSGRRKRGERGRDELGCLRWKGTGGDLTEETSEERCEERGRGSVKRIE